MIDDRVVEEISTPGQFFITIYGDGSIGIENGEGERIRGTSDDFIVLLRELANVIRRVKEEEQY